MKHWRLILAAALWAVSAVLWIPIVAAIGQVEALSASLAFALILLASPVAAMVASVWGLWHLRRA